MILLLADFEKDTQDHRATIFSMINESLINVNILTVEVIAIILDQVKSPMS